MRRITAHALFEVFIRSKRGLDHRHVGSLHAEDHQQALEYARRLLHAPAAKA